MWSDLDLLKACRDNDIATVKRLIESGVDVNTVVSRIVDYSLGAHRPIEIACCYNNLEIVKYLVSVGADLSPGSGYPMRTAVHKGSTKMVKYLVNQGVEIDLNVSLQFASKYGYFDLVKYLVKLGADITSDGDLAWKLSNQNGYYKISRYMFKVVRKEFKKHTILLLLNRNKVVGKDLLYLLTIKYKQHPKYK